MYLNKVGIIISLGRSLTVSAAAMHLLCTGKILHKNVNYYFIGGHADVPKYRYCVAKYGLHVKRSILSKSRGSQLQSVVYWRVINRKSEIRMKKL